MRGTGCVRDVATLTEDRQRIGLLIQERQKKQTETEKALETERQKSLVLARQVDNLKDLIGKVGAGHSTPPAGPPGRRRAPPRPRTTASTLAALNDPGRLAPAVAFASARGRLPIPVNGVRIQGIWGFRQPRRHGKGHFHRNPGRRPGHGAVRWLGGLCRTFPQLWPSLDT